MTDLADEILVALDATERGFVLGVLLAHPADPADLTVALEPPSDVRCTEALTRIAALPRPERVRLTGQLAREVVAPVPSGIDALDATVLADLLRDEPAEIVHLVGRMAAAPARLRAAAAARLAEGLAAEDGTRLVAPASNGPDDREVGPPPEMIAELQRAILSGIVPVPPAAEAARPLRNDAGALLALGPAELLVRLTDRGAGVLGLSLRGASADLQLRSAALVGPPWAALILAAARGPAPDGLTVGAGGVTDGLPDQVPDDDDPALDRAGAVRLVASTIPTADPRETVARVGARATGARVVRTGERGLGGAHRARALAQRLPRAIGEELLAAAGLGPLRA